LEQVKEKFERKKRKVRANIDAKFLPRKEREVNLAQLSLTFLIEGGDRKQRLHLKTGMFLPREGKKGKGGGGDLLLLKGERRGDFRKEKRTFLAVPL